MSDTPVRIGPPYTIRGVTYTPREQPAYDETGIASWYGSESGNRTANGERFRPDFITAAHKTLPLPSYVEVTALESGRTILVRVNDRGPFVAGRIIDLSRGAADALGVRRAGAVRVRVRRVEPREHDRAALRAGRMADARRAPKMPWVAPVALPQSAPMIRAEPPARAERTIPELTPRPPSASAGPRLRLELPPPEPDTIGGSSRPDPGMTDDAMPQPR